MSELVITDREGAAGESVEHFAEGTGTNAQHARLAQHSIEQDRAVDITVAVFTHHPDSRTGRAGDIEQGSTDSIELTDQPGHVAAAGAKPLGVVIEVRQVHKGQLGTLTIEDLGRRSGNPMRAGQPGARSPEGVERELSQFALEPVSQ